MLIFFFFFHRRTLTRSRSNPVFKYYIIIPTVTFTSNPIKHTVSRRNFWISFLRKLLKFENYKFRLRRTPACYFSRTTSLNDLFTTTDQIMPVNQNISRLTRKRSTGCPRNSKLDGLRCLRTPTLHVQPPTKWLHKHQCTRKISFADCKCNFHEFRITSTFKWRETVQAVRETHMSNNGQKFF